MAGDIGSNQTTKLEITVDLLQQDHISFAYKAFPSFIYDRFTFTIDEEQQGWLFGTDSEDGWDYASYDIEAGKHKLIWEYKKDSVDVLGGTSEVYIDDIFFPEETNFVGIDNESRSQRHMPAGCRLYHNYPNPFNAVTVIRYHLPVTDHVQLDIYTVTGLLVKTLVSEEQQAGAYAVSWNGRNSDGDAMPSGVYIYSLDTSNTIRQHKMILVK